MGHAAVEFGTQIARIESVDVASVRTQLVQIGEAQIGTDVAPQMIGNTFLVLTIMQPIIRIHLNHLHHFIFEIPAHFRDVQNGGALRAALQQRML